MSSVKHISFGSGQITFIPEVEPTPTTSETTGIVTVNNMGKPGIPAHFFTSFLLTVQIEESGVIFDNVLNWCDIIPSDDPHSSYRHIEDKAVRKLAPALRAVADRIDKALDDWDQKEKLKSSEGSK